MLTNFSTAIIAFTLEILVSSKNKISPHRYDITIKESDNQLLNQCLVVMEVVLVTSLKTDLTLALLSGLVFCVDTSYFNNYKGLSIN